MEAHAGHWCVDLEESLTLLGLSTGRGRRREGQGERGRKERKGKGKESHVLTHTHLLRYILITILKKLLSHKLPTQLKFLYSIPPPSSHTPYLPHPEVPYPGSHVFSSRVHELTVLMETDGCHILGNPLKHVHLQKYC